MKVNGRMCDICGEWIQEHARHEYKISRRFWEFNKIWDRIDMCENCYNKMIEWIKTNIKEGAEDMSD